MMWPGWDEPLRWGPGEAGAVVLAHVIIGVIAWVRWRERPSKERGLLP